MPLAPLEAENYNIAMTGATHSMPQLSGPRELAYDLVKGAAAYTGNALVASVAKVIATHPEAEIGTAFNHKQIACKMWARTRLLEALGGRYERIWLLGGWYGVLAAMLFEDSRFAIGSIDSFDIDPHVEAVARTLNAAAGGRFRSITADMLTLDYRGGQPGLVINTSCEHIADFHGWRKLLPRGTAVLLQSNDYFSEASHVNCMPSLAAFAIAAGLSETLFAGELPQKNYTRFMLIGRA